jgi:hypothetical protein
MPAMTHRFLQLATTQPALLVAHAQGYAALASEEWGCWLAHWRRRFWLTLFTVVCASLAAALGGVGILLWAVTPEWPAERAWVLWAVPLTPLALALWGMAVLRATTIVQPLRTMREQLALDMAALAPTSTAGAPGAT